MAGVVNLEGLVILESLNNASRRSALYAFIHVNRNGLWFSPFLCLVMGANSIIVRSMQKRVVRDLDVTAFKGASDIPGFLHSFLASMTSLLRSRPRSSPG